MGWKKIPIGQFIKNGQKLKELTDLNELMIIALTPKEWGSPKLRDYERHRVVREIRDLEEWINERRRSRTGSSESDVKRKIASFYSGLLSSSRSQMKGFRTNGYVWFHKEMAEQIKLLREEIDEACSESIDDLR